MEWSHYSEAIFDTWRSTDSNIIVQACPGAGKTTNIAHLWGLDDQSTVYVVFNKQNQLEAERKLQPKAGSAVLTTHSLGLRAITATYGRPVIDDRKVFKLIKRISSDRLRKLVTRTCSLTDLEYRLKKAVDVAKFSCASTELTQDAYLDMLSTFDLDSYEDMHADIEQVLAANDDDMATVDYADMIRLPALYACTMPVYMHVLCDEVQDFNSMQALLISKLHAQKYCFVGDRRQSIYGFRGAMLDAMDYLKATFACVELPLSISYRCPQAVVQEAARIWPEIEAWEHAIAGVVQRYSSEDERVMAELRSAHAADVLVLCRATAPLLTLAYQLLRQKVACYVRGRDVGQGLVRLVNQFPVQTMAELVDAVGEWEERECAVAALRDDVARRERVQDQAASVVVLAGHVGMAEHPLALVSVINQLFEQGRGIALSTVHKAKGLEAKQCYVLKAELFGAGQRRARTVWQREQEKNVQYVAVTRAQEALTLC